MSTDVQGTKWRKNTAENFNRLSRAHEHFRQADDRWTTTYSNVNSFAKNYVPNQQLLEEGRWLVGSETCNLL